MNIRSIRKLVGVSAAVMMFLAMGCWGPSEHQMAGRTMGTTYHIKVVAGYFTDLEPVQKKVDTLLEQINQSMSTFRPDSEISRFNTSAEPHKPFEISPHFLRVMLAAQEVYRLTGGAWDGTVHPLVDLWGFGRKNPPTAIPPAEAIQDARLNVGFHQIEIAASGSLEKKNPSVTIDLNSIAKGYAVEQVSILLRQLGYRDFLVEIGGEVHAAGRKSNGDPWRIGINIPRKGAAMDAVYQAVALQDQAMATSGDYRNFYQIDGRSYSHIIDPRTGYPVGNHVVSATVIADNCPLADGLATALIVMGPEKGLHLLNRIEGVEGLIIIENPDGSLKDFRSDGFPR